MKLKKLKGVGHNTAASYLSTLSLIGSKYTSTVIYRLAFNLGFRNIEFDILNKSVSPEINNSALNRSLNELQNQFIRILEKEDITFEAIKSFKLNIELLGNRKDVVDIRCRPIIIDCNNKIYECALVHEKYPEPI